MKNWCGILNFRNVDIKSAKEISRLAWMPSFATMAARGVDEKMVEAKWATLLGFEDGSFGTIHYLAYGGASFPKERIEVFAAGATLLLDNFLKLRGFNWPNFSKQNLLRQDKGQNACAKAFVDAVEGRAEAPIAPDELFEVARVSIEVAQLLNNQL